MTISCGENRLRLGRRSSSFLVIVVVLSLMVIQIFSVNKSPVVRIPPPLSSQGRKDHHTSMPNQQPSRIAVIIPFVASTIESIPAYFDLFCMAAYGSSALVDFLIFHNGVLEQLESSSKQKDKRLPSNVKFINLGSIEQLANTLMRVTDQRNLSKELRLRYTNELTTQLSKSGYMLVEFKPALGYIFQSYVQDYSHWAFGDFDVIFGDLSKWITPQELEDFDIVTYGFGDQNRVYMRGQFTFHKNNEKVNQVWRECKYLSELDLRLARIQAGEEKYKLESAEGCYSSAVLKRSDINVKYAVNAFTDVGGSDSVVHSNGVYIGFGNSGNETIVYRHKDKSDKEMLPITWYQDELYKLSPMQWEVNDRELVVIEDHNEDGMVVGKECMHWVKHEYQKDLCFPGLKWTETVFWLNGTLYKQRYKKPSFVRGIQTAPFFHFQKWKKQFKKEQLSACRRHGNLDGCILTSLGAIPIERL